MKPVKALAFDLGASNGRAVLGTLDGGKITTEEIYRFPNDPVTVNGRFYWDILRLFHEIKQGLIRCRLKGHGDIGSVGIDAWGVSFGFLDKYGDLLANPPHYRDVASDETLEAVFAKIPKRELFRITGLQPNRINSLFALAEMLARKPGLYEQAGNFLFVPDLLNYFLTGKKATEYTIASTSQLIDLTTKTWHPSLFDRLGLPERLFTKITLPGAVLAELLPEVSGETGLGSIPVTCTASHDTAASFAAVPDGNGRNAIISSGTWSAYGTVIEEPCVTEKSYEKGFTNEGCAGGDIRLLKNLTGLWILQECKREWEGMGETAGYAELTAMAEASKPFGPVIDPDDEAFFAPGDMCGRIREYCANTGQRAPETIGETARCIIESLAFKHGYITETMEETLGYKFSHINIVGGGIHNGLLCRATANAAKKDVVAGPAEAAVLGNIATQFVALGAIGSHAEAKGAIAKSVGIIKYPFETDSEWERGYEKAKRIFDS